mgnify:CR=1 FL=1
MLIVSVFMTGSLVYGQTGKVIHINQSEFIEKVYDYKKNPDKWVYEGSKPAIIDFYADWCGPCRRLSPVLEKLAEKYKDKIVIYKVNTDKERELAAAFGITSLPTLVFIHWEIRHKFHKVLCHRKSWRKESKKSF